MLERLRKVPQRVPAVAELGFQARPIDARLVRGGETLVIEQQQLVEPRRVERDHGALARRQHRVDAPDHTGTAAEGNDGEMVLLRCGEDTRYLAGVGRVD